MNKYLILGTLFLGLLFVPFLGTHAQYGPTLTAVLDSQTPSAQNISAGATYVDAARINMTASGGDVSINGIYLGTDISGGLSNFTNIYVYDVTSGTTLLDTYPNLSQNPHLMEFPNRTIANGQTKKYLIRVSLSSSASGNVRIGFIGFTYPTQTPPSLVNVPIYGNVMTLPGPTPTPTPSMTPTPTPTPTPTTSPTPASLGFTSLASLNLKEGDTISAAGSADVDIYIVNDWGYKRLFLNPIIFSFYGHLGGYANVNNVSPGTRDMLVTSGLFRNCETNDPKVYGIEVTGEDTGILHWVNTSGSQAVADDPDFFKKVFCINSNEFNWYQQGSIYTSVNQVPNYSRL